MSEQTFATSETDRLSREPWWTHPISAVCDKLRTHASEGLTDQEAASRLQQFGPNQLPEAKAISPLAIFIQQFNNFIIWVLLGAAAIAGFVREWVDATAIAVIILLNAILGFVQEYRAEQSIRALKNLSSPTSRVIRGKTTRVIPSSEVVPGDLIQLEAGDKIPADGRLIQAFQVRTQEAAMTGESLPVNKSTDVIDRPELALGDRRNMAFMGTAVATGKGMMIVTETGLHTELGKIAKMLEEAPQEETPLQKRLTQLGHRLVIIFLLVVVVVFILGILRGNGFIDMLLTALSLAVAAIPEGLPAVVTVALALGVRKMAKRNALIRHLPSVETLGCASVICTDKTGTLTENEMTVTKMWTGGELVEIEGAGYEPTGKFKKDGKDFSPEASPSLMMALKIGVLCNDADLISENNRWTIAGDPTEGALLTAGAKGGLKKQELEAQCPLVGEVPFDTERKRMSVLREQNGRRTLYVKGAPDAILKRSKNILMKDQTLPLTEEQRKKITETNQQLAGQALRILALAYRETASGREANPDLEDELTFAGLVAMKDPPREEAKEAVRLCKSAGIRVVMITGDHLATAVAIAREIGIGDESIRAVNGSELDEMDADKLQKVVMGTDVYARVSAEHKMKIVRVLKAKGEIVAMTGDGVNDAPAIKEASIGVAMGITGTDVTKEASEMVITDDNFASIVHAVEEGRGIYDNIIKFVNYLLSSNIAEILVLFLGMLFAFKDVNGTVVIPLTAVQLLWMNLVTDGLPAIALGVDPVAPGTMSLPPREPKEPILSKSLSIRIGFISLLITAGTLVACFTGLKGGEKMAQTMTLTTLICLQLVRVHMVRSEYRLSLFSNSFLLMALASSFLLQLVIIYLPPAQVVFDTVPLGWGPWTEILTICTAVGVLGTVINTVLSRFLSKRRHSYEN